MKRKGDRGNYVTRNIMIRLRTEYLGNPNMEYDVGKVWRRENK
jgi:hypothetical protein